MASIRADRDLARGRRAAAARRRAGGSVLEAACSQIEATFSPAMRHSILKDRVAALMRRGPGHPSVWSRYQQIAESHPVTELRAAIVLIERMRRAELDAQARAIRAWGRSSRPRMTLIMFEELRLMLRMLRRFAPARYRGLVAAMLAGGAAPAIAASAAVNSGEPHEQGGLDRAAQPWIGGQQENSIISE